MSPQRDLAPLSDVRPFAGNLLLRDLADKLFRRKTFILTLFVLLNLATAAYLVMVPKTYETEIKFLINNNRADAVVTPESSNGPVMRNYVDESVIATEIQLLSNKELLRDVILQCKLAKNSGEMALAEALKDLQKEIKISPVLKANMIKASYSSPDPKETAAVLQALADGYLSEHLRVHSTSGTYEFFDQQALQYQEQLRKLQAQLTEFQQQRDIVLLGQQKDLNLRKMVDLDGTLKETDAAIAESERRIDGLKKQLDEIEPRIATQERKVPNQYSIERLNTMLVELQNHRTELLTKFRGDDRMVKQVDQQIADTKAAMARAGSLMATEEATDVNPVRQTLEAELAKATLNAAGLRAKAGRLRKQLQDYRGSLVNMQHATADDDQLLRDIKEAEDNFFLYSKKREEARIAEAMDRRKIANVVLVEPPRPPLLPKAKLSGGLVAGYFLCSLLIVGLGYLVAVTRSVVYTPWELEGLTGLPVLASFSLRQALPAARLLTHEPASESIQ